MIALLILQFGSEARSNLESEMSDLAEGMKGRTRRCTSFRLCEHVLQSAHDATTYTIVQRCRKHFLEDLAKGQQAFGGWHAARKKCTEHEGEQLEDMKSAQQRSPSLDAFPIWVRLLFLVCLGECFSK